MLWKNYRLSSDTYFSLKHFPNNILSELSSKIVCFRHERVKSQILERYILMWPLYIFSHVDINDAALEFYKAVCTVLPPVAASGMYSI